MKRPFKRGSLLRKPAGEHQFKVVKCESRGCHHCNGTGLLWTVTLRGPYKIFQSSLDDIQRAGYVVVGRKEKEPTE